jgi:hypothetical protein
VIDTTHHIREDSFPKYDEIYKIFNTVYFPLDDEDLEVYQNIRRVVFTLWPLYQLYFHT